MKYSNQNPPMECIMTQSTCYKGTTKGKPVGILWHDTAAGQPNLWRYIQPDDNAPNKAELIAKIGKNNYGTDWNHKYVAGGVNAFIGKLANGEVTTVQVLPWNYRPWGCGSGPKGSCNGSASVNDSPFWIQFEIQDDSWSNAKRDYVNGTKAYFDKVYKEACEFTAYLCKKFDIDPNGTVNYRGVKVPTILCHNDSYKLGLGSGHTDVLQWFKKYNKNMTTVRKDVTDLLKNASTPIITPPPTVEVPPIANEDLQIGDLVKINTNAKYYSGKEVPAWVKTKNWHVKSLKDDRVVLGKSEDGLANLVSAFNIKDLTPIEAKFKPYIVRITANILNVRSGPSTDFAIKMTVRKGGVYTIIEEKNGWGKLKSGAGWINLQYTERK